MTQEKAKKRGRPAQLLQMAELHAFVEFLLEKDSRSELQNQVIDALQAEDFNFEMLSEPNKVLVKEALKPFREHLKLKLLYEELSRDPKRLEYEEKFIQLYKQYENGKLDTVDVNILKMMCTRYLKFKAQKLEYSNLELYLSQIQKKDAREKRKVENKRKFQVGGGVLAVFKQLNIDISGDTPEQIINRIVNTQRFYDEILQSEIFKEILKHKIGDSESKKIFLEVLKRLTTWEEIEIPVYCLEIESILQQQY